MLLLPKGGDLPVLGLPPNGRLRKEEVALSVQITLEDSIPPETYGEATEAAVNELRAYIAKSGGRRPCSLSVGLEGEEFVVAMTTKKAEIVRLARVTGYLSELSNFVPGKVAEYKDRRPHQT